MSGPSTAIEPPPKPAPEGAVPPIDCARRHPRDLDGLPRGTILTKVVLLALPMLGEQLGNWMIMLVDTYLAGQISPEAQAGVGVGGYLGWFSSAGFALVTVGAGALIARAFGARDIHLANRVLNQSLGLGLAVGTLVTVTYLFTAEIIAAAMLQTESARAICVQYLRVDAAGFWLYSLLLTGGAASRAAGDTRTPMLVMLAANVLNVVFSVAFVYGVTLPGTTFTLIPALGVYGIAVGTVIARSAAGVLMLVIFMRGLRGLRVDLALLRPRLDVLKRIARIGIPGSVEMSLLVTAQFVFVMVVARVAAGDAATATMAAHMIAMRAEGLVYLPAVALMTAASTLVGQYLGAQQPHFATRSGHTAALVGGAFTTLVGVTFYLLAEDIYRLLSTDEQVVAIGTEPFRIMAFIAPFLCMAIVYIGALRGAGDTRTTMMFSLVASICLRVPLAYLFGIYFEWGLIGAWCGMWADNLAKFLLAMGRFTQGGWRNVRV